MDLIKSAGEKLDPVDPASSSISAELDSLTLAKYCERYAPGEIALAVADRCVRAWLGVNASEISALFFVDYVRSGGGMVTLRSDLKGGGQYLRIRKGKFSKQELPG